MQLNEIELWLDMQLSPKLATWIENNFSIKTISSYSLFINNEQDEVIFLNAKKKGNVILISKDHDFLGILDRLKPPPKLIWLTMGNCPNKTMQKILEQALIPAIKELLKTSTTFIEIS
jgi:predicted nuclease of predicted toxin-antitoxin system